MDDLDLKLANITGRQAKDLPARNPLIIMPLGSIEDQGPHAPIGDYAIADRLCEFIAQANREAGVLSLVAPVMFGGDGAVSVALGDSPPPLTSNVADWTARSQK
ncbi:MAG: creatininase family protein [Rhizobiaceae bacterium]